MVNLSDFIMQVNVSTLVRFPEYISIINIPNKFQLISVFSRNSYKLFGDMRFHRLFGEILALKRFEKEKKKRVISKKIGLTKTYL